MLSDFEGQQRLPSGQDAYMHHSSRTVEKVPVVTVRCFYTSSNSFSFILVTFIPLDIHWIPDEQTAAETKVKY